MSIIDVNDDGLLKPVSAAVLPDKPVRTAIPGQVLAIVSVGICLANLDLFIVNVGLPNIALDFRNATLEDLSWVLNGYAIAYAALLVFFGRLAERFPRNNSFLLAVGLFTVASAACAFATSNTMLVAFRVLQAAGAALMTPTSLGLLLAVYPPEQRGSAVRTWTAIGGVAAALGPVVGGLLVTFSWRWIFLVNVPIGLVAMLIGWRKLPRVEGHDVPWPSPWAAIWVTGGVAALTFGITKINDWGLASAGVVGSLIAAMILLLLFAWQCLRSPNPFIPPALFRVRPLTGATLAMAPFAASFGGMLLSIALWEQTVWGWSALKTGLAIAPGPLLVPVTSLLFAGRLIARFGAAAVLVAGICIFASGLMVCAAFFTADPSFVLAAIAIVPTGIGVGLTFPTLMGVGTSALPPSSFATGSGVINMVRQTFLAVGVALFVAILGTPATKAVRIDAFHLSWWVLSIIALLGLIPALTLLRVRPLASR